MYDAGVSATDRDGNRMRWDGKRIRALRGHLAFTQAEMARELGTRQQTISEWETGMYEPRGTSATLLTIVAERANFRYEAAPQQTGRPRPRRTP